MLSGAETLKQLSPLIFKCVLSAVAMNAVQKQQTQILTVNTREALVHSCMQKN